MPDNSHDDWLSLDQAAERLGVNRIRVREAIAAGVIGARRDNRSFWRVSLAADIGDVKERMREIRLNPEALVELLFDEIEELNADLTERDSSLERLHAVAARQQGMLARALALAEKSENPGDSKDRDRLADLNERSLRLLETVVGKLADRDADIAKLTSLLDRAFKNISGLEGEVERHAEVAERQKSLLDRLFEIAHKKLDQLSSSQPRGRGWLQRLRRRRGVGAPP
jgi:septal ring factor EnvC (AmiA/AmiB activator)